MRRLQARCAAPLAPLHGLSAGELAALAWLVESGSQLDAQQRFPEQVLAVDFEDFLASVTEIMDRIAGHFGLPRDDRYLANLRDSSVLTRYSKAPERPFTPDQRARLLRESRQHNGDEIRRGMAWLENLARADEPIAAILDRVDGH